MQQIFIYVFDMILGIYFAFFRSALSIFLCLAYLKFSVGVFAVSGNLAVPRLWVIVTRDFRSYAQRQPKSFGFLMQQIFTVLCDCVLSENVNVNSLHFTRVN